MYVCISITGFKNKHSGRRLGGKGPHEIS